MKKPRSDIGERGKAKAAGLKTYFTGKPCVRGHIARRLTVNWTCLACLYEKQQQRLKNNPAYRRKVTDKIRQYRIDDPEKDRARHALWKRNNPDKIAQYNHSKRAMKLKVGGNYTASEAASLLESQDHQCANPYCRADLRVVKKHLDHKVPLSRDGSNSIENLQWLCESCNCQKWTYTNDEWMEPKHVAFYSMGMAEAA